MAGPFDVIVVGAGPAGLMAAIQAASCGASVTLLEADPVPGRKLLLTGGGRCNLTHAGQPQEILAALGSRGRFLRHALHELPPSQVLEFFGRLGLRTRVEADGCVFPASDRASDVRDALVEEAARTGVRSVYGCRVTDLARRSTDLAVVARGDTLPAHRVILASGGLSYPDTGSVGDGLRMASALGHGITTPRPALTPLVTQEKWPGLLSGVSLEHVRVSARPQGRRLSEDGPMLFTRDGVGGPVILDLSRHLTELLPNRDDPVEILVDLVPGMGSEDLEARILEWCQVNPRRTIGHLLAEFVPRRLGAELAGQAGCAGDLQACQFTKESRKKVLAVLKSLDLHVEATGPLAQAIVTRGGVDTGKIDPKTMESRVCAGLFFAGEVMDVDGPCGGYNLQIAWSTGFLAGRSAAGSM